MCSYGTQRSHTEFSLIQIRTILQSGQTRVMLLLGECFMPSLSRVMSTKPHCKATSPLHPRSFINTVQDQPVFSAPSSVKSYISIQLANGRVFLRAERPGEKALRSQPASWVHVPQCCVLGKPWHRSGTMQAGAITEAVSTSSAQLWRRFPADVEPLRTKQQPGQGMDDKPRAAGWL